MLNKIVSAGTGWATTRQTVRLRTNRLNICMAAAAGPAKLILSSGQQPYLCWNYVELSEMTDRRPNNSKITESHSVTTIAIEGKLVNCVENKTSILKVIHKRKKARTFQHPH